jgi:Flp pilus assembly pilin Flp
LNFSPARGSLGLRVEITLLPFREHPGGIRVGAINSVIAAIRQGQRGQGLAEYALILALVAIVVIVALQFLGQSVATIMSKVGASV